MVDLQEKKRRNKESADKEAKKKANDMPLHQVLPCKVFHNY